ncbi:hypothetical protein P9D34_00535 [Bacillus swezeyi]|uniref:Restriction endonuclease n=1 Tax=Bacillus swezeyi TaxID=1925020 RepID=A0A1R1S247_9BACI|nr:hypothetical protein [Bacillus swezeyi]MEC1258945.1 hypothetical protein [Bacillus swezeyi]MED2928094.1 hypothetical protein [Bacillus swezeyi]MED2964994.1 hypothetical protein [Bacillus swezeyi]MED3071255.1 hypothetical protein [Bacillus swezeyi]MED3081107.1 hypothetical protein [Bacillus swezeyi]
MINEFLNIIAKRIEQNKSLKDRIKDGDSFEKHVYEEMKKVSLTANKFNVSNVEHNGSHSFPDLKVTFSNNTIYGVEIKFSASGNWKSKGNSVFESLSNKESDDTAYKDIFVFFGRKPKTKEDIQNIEIKFATYGSSIDKIEVTHSPRFSINMNQKESDLTKLFGLDNTYTDFRVKSNEEKNKLLRMYFQKVTKQSASDKWYMPNLADEDLSVEPLLFSSLNNAQKQQIIAESFILFPFDLFKRRADYINVASYMISKHFVYSTALRDPFSASGKTIILEKDIKYPHILMTFYNHKMKIKEVLRNPPSENFERDCYKSWGKALNENHNPKISLNKEADLEFSFEKIIKNFKPELEIEDMKTNDKRNVYIDLSKFYHLELI